MDEGLKRYTIGRLPVEGSASGARYTTLVPSANGEAVMYADHVASTEALRKALEGIVAVGPDYCPEQQWTCCMDKTCEWCRARAALAASAAAHLDRGGKESER